MKIATAISAAALAAMLSLPAHAATLKHVTLACATKQEFDLAWSELAEKDWTAIAKQELNGECTNLPAGETVYIVGHEGLLSTTVKIRVRGSASPVWTDISFLRLDANGG